MKKDYMIIGAVIAIGVAGLIGVLAYKKMN